MEVNAPIFIKRSGTRCRLATFRRGGGNRQKADSKRTRRAFCSISARGPNARPRLSGGAFTKPPRGMNVSTRIAFALALLCPQIDRTADEAAPPESFDAFAARLHCQALQAIEPKVVTPIQKNEITLRNRYPWKTKISTVLFFVGESGGKASAWDEQWAYNFGAYDNPESAQRRNYPSASFVPNLDPFYVALPYNDLAGVHHKPDARTAIPWFAQADEREGESAK